MSLLKELQRRQVLRVAAAYVVSAWLIIQVAETVFPVYGLSNSAIRLVITILAIGLVPVSILAWVFELTPDGLKIERGAGVSRSVSPHTGRKLDRVIMVMLALGIGYFALDKFVLDPARDARLVEQTARHVRSDMLIESFGENSIAVLPFVNMSSDPEQEYFSDGISEELLNFLAKIPGLRVISRSSAFRFKGQDIDVPAVGRQLNVGHVLEGSVRKAGNQIRIAAQLIEARSDTQLWSATYERELSAPNVFEIQTQIARDIAAALNTVLTEHDRKRLARAPTQNLEAYEAYLLGLQRMATRTRSGLLEAADYFNRAVGLDSHYALAYVGLADVNLLLSSYGYQPAAEGLAKAEPALARALSIDAQLAAAHASIGLTRNLRGNSQGAYEAFERAIALDPNLATSYHWYADTLINASGQFEKAVSLLIKARALDPMSPIIDVTLGEALEGVGRFEEAMTYYRKALEIEPGHPPARTMIAQHYWAVSGRLDEAVRWFQETLAASPDQDPSILGMICLDLGDDARAEYWIDRAITMYPDGFLPILAQISLHRYRGEKEEALQAARRLLEIAPGNNASLVTMVNFGRFREAIETIGPSQPGLSCEAEPVVTRANLFHAINLSLALQETGEEACAYRLLDGVAERLPDIPRLGIRGFGFLDVEVYARQGKTRQALEALRQAIDMGRRQAWWTQAERSPHTASLQENPEFRAMMAEIKADLSIQLAHVHEMEASGELAPVSN